MSESQEEATLRRWATAQPEIGVAACEVSAWAVDEIDRLRGLVREHAVSRLDNLCAMIDKIASDETPEPACRVCGWVGVFHHPMCTAADKSSDD